MKDLLLFIILLLNLLLENYGLLFARLIKLNLMLLELLLELNVKAFFFIHFLIVIFSLKKADKSKQREVTTKEGLKIAQQLGCDFVEASAVNRIFFSIQFKLKFKY